MKDQHSLSLEDSPFLDGLVCHILYLSPSFHRFVQTIYLTCPPFRPCNTPTPVSCSIPLPCFPFVNILEQSHAALLSDYESTRLSVSLLCTVLSQPILSNPLFFHTFVMVARYVCPPSPQHFFLWLSRIAGIFSLVNYTLYTNLVVLFRWHSHNVYLTLFRSRCSLLRASQGPGRRRVPQGHRISRTEWSRRRM